VTTTWFDVLGVTPVLGRTFRPADDLAGGAVGWLISERLWRTRFGATPDIIGRTLRVGSPPRSVPIIGVVPKDFRLLGRADFWEHLPLVRPNAARGQGFLRVVGRLRPGTTIEQAGTDIGVIAGNIERIAPATNKGRGAHIQPLQNAIAGDDLRRTTFILAGAVLFVLLLACANVANLILVRGIGRMREMAMRAALGATQARIATQFLTESAVLAIAGGITGVAIAWAILRTASVMLPPQLLPDPIVLGIDWRVGVFAVGITALTALIFGLAPGWQAARVPLVEAISSGGRGSSDRAGLARQALAVIQVATALLLVTGAGLLIRTWVSLSTVDAGYRADNLVTMSIRLPFRVLNTAEPGELSRYWRSIEDEIAGVAGVQVAALGSDVPLGGVNALNTAGQPFDVADGVVRNPADRPTAHYHTVSPAYFAALGIPIVRGRAFGERDAYDAMPVAIVNQEFARRHLPGGDPIGRRITVQNPLSFRSPPVTREIVGIVRQVKTRPDEPSDRAGQIYVPLAQNNWLSPAIIVRTAADPMRLVAQIKAAVARADPTQAVTRIRTMETIESEAIARPRLRAQLVAAFAAVALVLAAVGIFSVLTFMARQRSREFSIRLAVGASAQDLLRLVLGNAFKLTVTGIVIGLASSAVLARALESVLFGIAPLDRVTFLAAPALLALVTLLACLSPALAVLRSDPVAAVRSDT
jgi:predicted permease